MLDDLMDDAEVVRSILTHFSDWQHAAIRELDGASRPRDNKHLQRVAHSLRGTLAQIHADVGAELAGTLELQCKAGQPIAQDIIDRLKAELHEIDQDVLRYLTPASP
ncbi:Hpt domain-containing protein [Azoarcus sp. L1K30]|uniref:Hpt domain-containing protein n=1 Tax=Azoarcus sp. L1K30 TaxID=2820277 RepID=UPI001B82C321|nr:Hpt domain-containing protein [Azoarcus sp. L1K30]MBR0565856.1 Hpt domain-containing protein [Azoarcus sp. L1K30]